MRVLTITLLLLGYYSVFGQIVEIPDRHFKSYLLREGDSNGDGEIQVNEALSVTSITCETGSIISTKGIEYFENLEYCEITNNKLKQIDLSNNTKLTTLYLWVNEIEEINLSKLTKLKNLALSYNKLTEIDLSNNLVLERAHISLNKLTEIDVSNNLDLKILSIWTNNISQIDLSKNVALEQISCSWNEITELDVSNLPRLTHIGASGNSISEINISNNPLLEGLYLDQTPLTIIDVSHNPVLKFLALNQTSLKIIDVSHNNNLVSLDVANNPLLSQLNIKNGSELVYFELENSNNLRHICVDEFEIQDIYRTALNEGLNPLITSYCSFNPGGNFYSIKGKNYYDDDAECNAQSTEINSYVKFEIEGENNKGSHISYGKFSIPLEAGTHTITPQLAYPEYFHIHPQSVVVTLPNNGGSFLQDFCISPKGETNDLEISLIPIDLARPGFESSYKIKYQNNGTTTQSGNINLFFPHTLMQVVSTSPIVSTSGNNLLSWEYSELQPFESGEILVIMELNRPTDTPPLAGGEILHFLATISPVADDETIINNTHNVQQTVVNSFDPNDKTCLEGSTITEELIGEYVHYLIRFENTGTAEAINVVIKDEIDITKFDISSLQITDSSHEMVTRINDDNIVEFIFENILLPFDDDNNDGYVAFKIKTLPTLTIRDSFENDAEIFFDFNFPILTNIAKTNIEVISNNKDLDVNLNVNIFPNPTEDMVHINSEKPIHLVEIFNIQSQLVHQDGFFRSQKNISISIDQLPSTMYVVYVYTDAGVATKKLVKE